MNTQTELTQKEKSEKEKTEKEKTEEKIAKNFILHCDVLNSNILLKYMKNNPMIVRTLKPEEAQKFQSTFTSDVNNQLSKLHNNIKNRDDLPFFTIDVNNQLTKLHNNIKNRDDLQRLFRILDAIDYGTLMTIVDVNRSTIMTEFNQISDTKIEHIRACMGSVEVGKKQFVENRNDLINAMTYASDHQDLAQPIIKEKISDNNIKYIQDALTMEINKDNTTKSQKSILNGMILLAKLDNNKNPEFILNLHIAVMQGIAKEKDNIARENGKIEFSKALKEFMKQEEIKTLDPPKVAQIGKCSLI